MKTKRNNAPRRVRLQPDLNVEPGLKLDLTVESGFSRTCGFRPSRCQYTLGSSFQGTFRMYSSYRPGAARRMDRSSSGIATST